MQCSLPDVRILCHDGLGAFNGAVHPLHHVQTHYHLQSRLPTVKVHIPIPLVNSFCVHYIFSVQGRRPLSLDLGNVEYRRKTVVHDESITSPLTFPFLTFLLACFSLGGLCLWGFAVQDVSSTALASCHPSLSDEDIQVDRN